MSELSIDTSQNMSIVKNDFTESLSSDFIRFLDAKPKTIETYRRALKQFFIFLKERNITHPTRETTLAFKEALINKNKATTVQNYIVTVRLFFRWLDQQGIYKNIADKIKSPTISKAHKKDYLTSNQIKHLLSLIDCTNEQGLRDYTILVLMVTGGLRTIEIARADICDLRNIGDSAALFIQGKGQDEKTEYVKLAPPVEKAIRNYLAIRSNKKETALFVSISNNNAGLRLTTRSISGIVKSRLRQAGYDSSMLTAHSLRHTAGTLNLLNGGNLEETQQLLRHSNINTTMIYLHHIERSKNVSEQRIANAIFD